MQVRRVFWIHHVLAGEKTGAFKKQTDFDAALTHEECQKKLCDQFGYPPTEDVRSFSDFAEVRGSQITEDKREDAKEAFPAKKHFGTDCLFGGVAWSEIEVNTGAKKRKKKLV